MTTLEQKRKPRPTGVAMDDKAQMTECSCKNWCRRPGEEGTGDVICEHHPNCPAHEGKKRFASIKLIGGGQYTQPFNELFVLIDEIKEGQTGEKWEIEIIEMYQEEYDKLPEFTGH